MTSTAAGRPGSEPVENAARRVLDTGLRDGDSAFTPGRPVWTAHAADELDRRYVQRPDDGRGNFVEKLGARLVDADPLAVQLAAELLYLNVLPLTNVSGTAKRSRINTVLSWLPEPVPMPDDLDAALDSGVFNGGVGFNVMLRSQLVHLVAFVQAWWQLDDVARAAAGTDPWAWKRFVESVGGGNAPSQRHSLKYLAFPGTFSPIVRSEDRKLIREAYRDLLEAPGDIDRDLFTIRKKLQAASPAKQVDFYVDPWQDAWRLPPPPPGQHAWLVRASPHDQADVIQQWINEGFVALPAERLRALPVGTKPATVRKAVATDYAGVDYERRKALVKEFHAFLVRMRGGDVVATLDGEAIHLGFLDRSPPTLVEAQAGGRLRRKVAWQTADDPLPVVDLPGLLPTSLATQGTVVDLSEHVEALLALMGPGTVVDDPAQPPLPPATDELAERLHVDRTHLQEWIDLLTDRQQVIFYGPPGTGKTFLAERLARFLAGSGTLESDRVALVQFHPSTSYEDFIEGYRPAEVDAEGRVGFSLSAGPLIRLVSAAREDPIHPHFLLVDEINRANLAKVFGELYYLLEYRDSGIQLLYRPPGKLFTLPRNVFLIGTMNTADRSIALVDAAMRRRFAFIELHPDEEPVKGLLRRWLAAGKKDMERADLLDALNARINDRDFKIGPSYLMKADADRKDGLSRVWKYSILPLLVEHHYSRLTAEAVANKYGLKALRADLPGGRDSVPVEEDAAPERPAAPRGDAPV